MLSGSAFGSKIVLERTDYPVAIDVLGREAPPGWRRVPGVTYHGRVRDPRPSLTQADLVVVNGGFSAVSEMYCMAKPMVVVPVRNHAEQWINGKTIEYLGVGLIAGEDEIEAKLLDGLERLPALQRAYAMGSPKTDGATEAATFIMQVATTKTRS
jgi:UDP:flavonoid glycosyltransferase YjiC (YdhE family)